MMFNKFDSHSIKTVLALKSKKEKQASFRHLLIALTMTLFLLGLLIFNKSNEIESSDLAKFVDVLCNQIYSEDNNMNKRVWILLCCHLNKVHKDKEFKISSISLFLLKLSVMASSICSAFLLFYYFDHFIYTCKIFTTIFVCIIHSSLISVYFNSCDSVKFIANFIESEDMNTFLKQKSKECYENLLSIRYIISFKFFIWISSLSPIILAVVHSLIHIQYITIYQLLASVFSSLLIFVLFQLFSPKHDTSIEHLQSITEKLCLFKTIITKIPLPIFVTDLTTLHFVSKKARMLIDNYGLAKKDIFKVEYLITGGEGEPMKLKDIISKNYKTMNEIRIEREMPNSGLHYYQLKMDTIEYKDQNLHVFLLNDITEIKESEEERALTKFKAVMFASMTHEIRTPLNAIINSCDVILADQNMMKLVIDCVEICKSSASLLMYMTFNILDFSRMESGEFRQEKMPFQICTLIEKIAFIAEPHARLKKLIFELDIEDELENLQILNDERRIMQVLLNLIMNAVKYTFKGKIRLKIRHVNVSSRVGPNAIDKLYLLFSVVDTGQGISEEKQSKLFKLFGNTDNHNDYRQSTSIGLGLAVSKNIIDNMGGCLGFYSELNTGTLFTFAIPLNLEEDDSDDFDDNLNYITQNLSKIIFPNIKHNFDEIMSELEDIDFNNDNSSLQKLNDHEFVKEGCLSGNSDENLQNDKVILNSRSRSKGRLINMSNVKSKSEWIENYEIECEVPSEFLPCSVKCLQSPPLFLDRDASIHRESIKRELCIKKMIEAHSSISDEDDIHRRKIEEEKELPNIHLTNKNKSDSDELSNKSNKNKERKLTYRNNNVRDKKLEIYNNKSKKSYDGIKIKNKTKVKPKDYPRGKSDEKRIESDPLATIQSSMLRGAPSATLNIHPYSQMIIDEAESKDEKDNSSLKSQSELTEKFYKGVSKKKINNFHEVDQEISEESEICEIKDCECHKILVVDDNAFNSQVLSMMIKNFFSIEVDIVFDGFSAIEKVKDKMNNAC